MYIFEQTYFTSVDASATKIFGMSHCPAKPEILILPLASKQTRRAIEALRHVPPDNVNSSEPS